jgi:DNA helicase HerA-like ATPase
MSFVLGRADGDGPTARLGQYRARDGSPGAGLELDVDGPHAVAVVGKRGYGKSYTLGVLAEELATTAGLAPVVLDPMGVFAAMAELDQRTDRDEQADNPQAGEGVRATVIDDPVVDPAALDPRTWCALVGLDPESAAGALLWQAASRATTIAEIRDAIVESDGDPAAVRAARNHLRMAHRWGVFAADGLTATDLATGSVTVVDLSGCERGPANAVARVVADTLYRARVDDSVDRLPWLLVDEAHAFFDGVADEGFRRLLTRGRSPGVSFVAATQRPAALPAVCLSQSDIVVAHRLTTEKDIEALDGARPTYMDEAFDGRLPTDVGEVLVVDDRTETVHGATIRERTTPHGGDSPSVSEQVDTAVDCQAQTLEQ